MCKSGSLHCLKFIIKEASVKMIESSLEEVKIFEHKSSMALKIS